MKRTSMLSFSILAAVAAACAQHAPSSDDGQPHASGAGASPAAVAAVPANGGASATPAAAPSGNGHDCNDDWAPLPGEKFTDAQHNFEEVKKMLLDQYYDPAVGEEELYRAAVAGMLLRVDPAMSKWNKLLTPSQYAELKRDLNGELVGVGIRIKFDPATGHVAVLSTFPGSPADRAGLAPPDEIVAVDGKLYKGMTERDVVNDIRGKAGETVTLSVLRGDKILSVPVKREMVQYDSPSDLVVAGDVGYVRIPSFNAKTPAALRSALEDLRGKAVHSLVVDLRCNPGGSFDDAVSAASELLPAQSTVARLQKRGGAETITSKDAPVLTGLPLAVLVDHDTSSGGELVAAALQEDAHAVLVGERTFGKWTVQTISDLPNGYAVKFTLALFQTPGGKAYQGVGMPPDVEVDVADDAIERIESVKDPAKRLDGDVQLRTAVQILQRGH